jgi:hypothetical protein
MDKAKAAVTGFLSNNGKHNTVVHETVNPAVQNEHVTKTLHNETTTAIDREVHQDHHHTTVQPILHKEVLPEKHTHSMGEVEHRHITHGNEDHIKHKLEAEKLRFKNTMEIGKTEHTTSAAPTISSEHVHHHVHEIIQPVIQKETIQPTVVHTTVPVHEVHHNEAKHHTATALPAITLDEFKAKGGTLTGNKERVDTFKGEPRSIEGLGLPEYDTKNTTHQNGLTHDDDSDHYQLNGKNNMDGTSTGAAGDIGIPRTATHGHKSKKASLIDKINPKVDSNGDGIAGFMK